MARSTPPPLHFVTNRRSRRPAPRGRPSPRHPPLPDPGGVNRVLASDRSRHDLSSLRNADTDLGDAPSWCRRSATRSPHTTTIIYGSTEAGPGTLLARPTCCASRVGRTRRARCDRAPERHGRGVHHREFLMDGYFEQPTPPRRRSRTAGTTPAISARSTTRATCRSGRARDVMRTGARPWPARGRGRAARPSRVMEVRSSGSRRRLGEVVCASSSRYRRRATSTSTRCGPLPRPARAYKQPRRVELVDALPRTPRPSDPADPHRRTHRWREPGAQQS